MQKLLMKNALRLLYTLVALFTFIAPSSVLANVVGSDTQNFNPNYSGLDFVTAHSSETLAPGVVNFGLFLNQAVNTLPYFEKSPQERQKFSDTLLGADLNIGVGVLRNLDLGLSLPQILHQRADSSGFHGRFQENGNTEIRIAAKLRLFGDESGGFAILTSANINRMKDNPFVGEKATPIYNIELIADTTVSDLALALNLGYRFRKPGKEIEKADPIVPIKNQMIASTAVSYLMKAIDTKVIFEIFGSKAISENKIENADRLAQSAEALLGLKHDLTSDFSIHGGFGSELVHGQSSPDWRFYTGINWTIGSRSDEPRQAQLRSKQSAASMPVRTTSFDGPPQAHEQIVIHDVLFEFNSATLVVGEADRTLSKLARHVVQGPGYKQLIITGHTDSVGSDAYNLQLSQRRANTIRNWLISKHRLNGVKVIAVGKGERLPIADNGNAQGRQLNRRVEFTIYRDLN